MALQLQGGDLREVYKTLADTFSKLSNSHQSAADAFERLVLHLFFLSDLVPLLSIGLRQLGVHLLNVYDSPEFSQFVDQELSNIIRKGLFPEWEEMLCAECGEPLKDRATCIIMCHHQVHVQCQQLWERRRGARERLCSACHRS
jgi:hypothetical protein